MEELAFRIRRFSLECIGISNCLNAFVCVFHSYINEIRSTTNPSPLFTDLLLFLDPFILDCYIFLRVYLFCSLQHSD